MYTLFAYSSPTIQVARYGIGDTSLYSSFTEDNSNNITQDPEQTSLYMTKYIIKPKDLEAVFNDMVEKLAAVYGAPINSTVMD